MGKPRTRYSPKQKKMSEPGLSGTTELDIPPTKYGKQTTPGTLPSRSEGQRRDQPRTKPPRGKKRSSKGSTPLSHTKKQALSRSFTPQGPGSLLTDSTTSESVSFFPFFSCNISFVKIFSTVQVISMYSINLLN